MADDGKVVVLEVVARQRTIEEGGECAPLDVIGVLEEALARARRGEVSAVFIAERGVQGEVLSRWAHPAVSRQDMIGMLAVLQHDLMAARS
jgi:hypothetical protein